MVYLDPDYRKNPDTSKLFCVRCQKPLLGKSHKVTVNELTKDVTLGGEQHIGTDCAKKIGLI